MSRLGDTIRAGRIKAKMTEKALAKKCGVAESFIKDVESGRKIVSDEQAQRILKVRGGANPVSTELEVAAEPEVQLRPKPRPYIIPVEPEERKLTAEEKKRAEESADAWLDALGGVVKRVPVIDENGVVIDHILTPVIGGKIEGGAPDKVMFYRCQDDMLRGFRVYAGDLLLTVPTTKPEDEAIMLMFYKGKRIVRKVLKLDGARLLLQAYDREFSSERVPMAEVQILGRCVKLQRTL